MSQKKIIIILIFIIVLLIGVITYMFYVPKTIIAPTTSDATSTPQTTSDTVIRYQNEQYGFTFDLPLSWKGYEIITDEWEGYSLDSTGQNQTVSESGPLISLRHPDWEYKAPRQDIPIMVFTIDQWNEMQADKFHIGAAPINPSELGRNSQYVFALPARYNFAYLTGYEEVEAILKTNPLHPF